jgi:hypothetical protein
MEPPPRDYPVTGPPVLPPPGPGRPVAGFLLDLVLAIVLLLALSLASGLAWAVFETLRLVVRGAAPDVAALVRELG